MADLTPEHLRALAERFHDKRRFFSCPRRPAVCRTSGAPIRDWCGACMDAEAVTVCRALASRLESQKADGRG
jgi:hypothetical protein